jgi:diguanylate cyclase (GGDEF)-like protein/PAS domain S-box-containing protein
MDYLSMNGDRSLYASDESKGGSMTPLGTHKTSKRVSKKSLALRLAARKAAVIRAAPTRDTAKTNVSTKQVANIFRNASVGLAEIDGRGHYILVNDTFCKIVGRTRENILSLTMADLTHPDDLGASERLVRQLVADKVGVVIEKRYVRPDGSTVECRTSVSVNLTAEGAAAEPLTIVAVIEDVTERKRAEARVNYLATHDNLTDLPNRLLLNAALAQEFRRRQSGGRQCAVLAVDLDRFKDVNDSFGHDVGDELLRQVAARLRNAVRAGDTVSRVGEDEFVILQVRAIQPKAASRLATRVQNILARPFEVKGRVLHVGSSIGISLHMVEDETAAILLKAANVALYHAKGAGGENFQFFEPAMNALAQGNRELEHDLHLAIGTEQLNLHFQPQFDCQSGILLGFEALLRWQHPTRGAIPPLSFIPIAEMTCLIVPLGVWAIEKACSEAVSWPAPVRVAVNVSSLQFLPDHLTEHIKAILARTGLAANRLELELTESALFKDSGEAMRTFRELKELGVRLALDDFGTGYSSLGYLRHFAFDRLKIDKSFVDGLGQETSSLSLLQAIIAMGRSLGIEVIAEGVETALQLKTLCEEGCGQIQGFFLGRPAPAEDLQHYFTSSPAEMGSKGAKSLLQKSCWRKKDKN